MNDGVAIFTSNRKNFMTQFSFRLHLRLKVYKNNVLVNCSLRILIFVQLYLNEFDVKHGVSYAGKI